MDSLFFILSKTLNLFLTPSFWLLAFALASWWLVQTKRWHKIGRALGICLAVEVLLIGFFPLGSWLANPLETGFDIPVNQQEPDGIIVLGGAWRTDISEHWSQWELNHAAERELAFIALAREFPNAKLVFTGGSGRLLNQKTKEATFAEMLYEDMGIDLERVYFESASRNTYENGLYSKQLVNPQENENWLLITSAYHMPRSLGVFCAQNWSVTPYPVDHFYHGFSLKPHWAFADHLWELERVVREWVGLYVYRLTGKSNQLIHSSCS